MRRWWHERRGHTVEWRIHPPVWIVGDPKHMICSCGSEWWE